MRAHFPKRTLSGVSNVETMSPPKQINFVNKKTNYYFARLPSTCAKRSTPSKSACSIAITPFSANNCSG